MPGKLPEPGLVFFRLLHVPVFQLPLFPLHPTSLQPQDAAEARESNLM